MIKNNGDMWALNSLVAVGLIAIFLFGFFMVATAVLPGDVAEIRAEVAESSYSSQVLSLFRVPVRGLVVADFVSFGSKSPSFTLLKSPIVREVVEVFVPVGSDSLSSVNCSDLEDSLRFVYGKDVGYHVSVDEAVFCSKGAVKKNPIVAEFVLPAYDGSVYNISVEVFK